MKDWNNNYCMHCLDCKSPYISRLGVESPCFECVGGKNFRPRRARKVVGLKVKSREHAKMLCPWACTIVEVVSGQKYLAFKNCDDYIAYKTKKDQEALKKRKEKICT